MKIITDTGSMISRERAKELNVDLIPLQVEINGKNYRDYFEIDSKKYIEEIAEGVPQSSQPAIGDVMETFDKHKDGFYIAMTSGLSSTYVSAAGLQADYPKMTIFNSKTLAGTQQYLVELAATLSDKLDHSELKARLDKALEDCKSYLIPVDFDFLKRNGRLSPLAALMSGLLKIKPIVFHQPGMEKLEKFGVARSWKQAIDSIIEDMKKNNVSEKFKVYISHADNPSVASQFVEAIKEKIEGIDIQTLLLSPVMITQGGPGCVSIQYIIKDED